MSGLNVVPIRPAKVRSVGKVHVWRHEIYFEVIHESASGASYGSKAAALLVLIRE